jgi:hypothetical protein
MQTATQILFIAICLWVIYAAIRYSGPAQIQVLGVFASDGTRLDRPMHRACAASVVLPSNIAVSGPVDVAFSDSGRIVITGRGPLPGRVTIRR